MSQGVLQRIDRRGFLVAAAIAIEASSQAIAQTLISDTPSSDVGFARPSFEELTKVLPLVHRTQPDSTRYRSDAPAVVTPDWRRSLLVGERSILMRRDGATHRIRYCTKDGLLDRDGYAMACFLLRDVKAGKLTVMDPGLLDLLCGMQRWAQFNGYEALIQLLSGFRSKGTNDALLAEGAAMNSLHLVGKAADIVIEGFDGAKLGAMAKVFNAEGGTGIYINRGFAHIDTGASRSWISESRRKAS